MRDAAIERLSADDLVSFAEDCGAVPLQAGLVVLLDAAPDGPADPLVAGDRIVRALEARLAGVRRMRQRLVRPPAYLGRPYWVDDPHFDIARHVRVVVCSGGPDAALAVADDLVTTRLPWDRPLWAARVVVGLDAGAAAVAFTAHHVMADGVAGLGLLRRLADGPPPPPDPDFPRPAPTRRQLLADALRGWGRAVRMLPAVAGHVRDGLAIVRATWRPPIAPSSLNRPTGPTRRTVALTRDLPPLRAAAHGAGGTVHDLVLTALGAALGGLLAARGERVDAFVVSVVFSTRTPDAAATAGNRAGLIAIAVPVTGTPQARFGAVVAHTRVAKSQPRVAANTVLGAAVRAMGALRLFHWFSLHQRVVHTFESTLRVPGDALTVAGRRVGSLHAQAIANGNQTVVFVGVEYLDRLTLTAIGDPVACPDLDALPGLLDAALDDLVAHLPG